MKIRFDSIGRQTAVAISYKKQFRSNGEIEKTALLMAGGGSTRLGTNKLGLRIHGENGPTIFQEGLKRIHSWGFDDVLVVTTEENLLGLKGQFDELGKKGNFIIVGRGQDTGPAIIAAYQYLIRNAGLGLTNADLNNSLQVMTFNGDHVVPNPEILGHYIRQGLNFARKNSQIATVGFGLEAARAEDLIGMGAVVPSERPIHGGNIYQAGLFEEKSVWKRVQQLYGMGAMTNFGYYIFGNSFFQRAEEIIPSVMASTQRAVSKHTEVKEDGHSVVRLDMEEYGKSPVAQFDRGFVQKLGQGDRAVVRVPENGRFIDIGSPTDLLSQLAKYPHGNGVIGRGVHLPSKGLTGSLVINQYPTPFWIKEGVDINGCYFLRREDGSFVIGGISKDSNRIADIANPESVSKNMRQIHGQNVWVSNGYGLTNCRITNSTDFPVYVAESLRNMRAVVDENRGVMISPH